MEEAGATFFVGLIGLAISGGIGYLIGHNRKIGGGWSFVLGAILGVIGWIIAACSEKTNNTKFDDMSKDVEGNA
ncbi:MAG: hypothetical protein IJ760_03875 [Bacteroidales bacterium]|nr:hypothetical protein [Bacteroidales bacterium]